ncbi:MAG: FGGY-family carbohydrate kinase [Candidatus Hydrogenedentes bacterium]|nr:FGGY-family carbohydrate kinase [Candidatus Hydrogenedentota bacterium]
MSLLGLDVGTTGAKGVAFDLEGKPIAQAYREYPLHSPKPGWLELDPDQVWQLVRDVLSEIASKTRHDPIRAMAISSQGEAVHAVDKTGACLTHSPVTFDARTAEIPAWWLERKSRYDLAFISGMPLHGMYSLNKILWFKQNQPDVFAKTWKWMCYEDFVQFRLGVTPTMSHSLAARTMALDARQGKWSNELLDIADVPVEMLPDTKPSGAALGTIPDAVATEIGLPRGIVVSTGGHDQPAGALGAGIFASGEAVYATGTVDCICPIFDNYAVTKQTVAANLCCYPSCVPGLFASIAFNFTGGSLLKWYRDTFAGEERRLAAESGRDVYEVLCGNIPDFPENLIILPHFTVTGTPYFDTASRGAILGLTLNTTREEIVSAILSGVTYEMKLNLEVLQSAGTGITRLRAIGGGAKSRIWIQRKADIMGVPVAVLATTEAAALGVALLAGHAAGLVRDVRAALASAVRIEYVCDPDPLRSREYEKRYNVYRDVYGSLKDINHRLAAFDRQAQA